MRAVVATHGHCFDGLCSAVLFARLLQAVKGRSVDFQYHACGYSPGQRAVSSLLDGDDNAILDYRFSADERLGWYFDHHRTAFANAEDQRFFEQRQPDRPYYHDTHYGSCARLVSDVARQRYAVDLDHLETLTLWADKIDSAAFESAEAALDHSDPVMQLASVVEHHGDQALLSALVPRLLRDPVEIVASRSENRRLYEKIRRKKADFSRHVAARAKQLDRVVLVDLSQTRLETYGKFVTYALYPDAMYSVLLGTFGNGARINVGYNPWSTRGRDRDLSSICGRYGGGGHPFVGGISFGAAELPRARRVAREIARELEAA